MGAPEEVMATIATRVQGVSARRSAVALGQPARTMATLKQTELRIKSTANIAKITKAMQMVAAAKLRGAEMRLEGARPLMDMVEDMSSKFDGATSKKTTFVPITTDRGLCGGVNIQIAKKVSNVYIPEEEAAGSECNIVCIGDKGRTQFNRLNPDALVQTVTGLFAQVLPNFGQASAATEQVLDQNADKYSIVYNKFFSAVSQVPTRVDIYSANALSTLDKNPIEDYEMEKTNEELISNLTQFQMATAMFAALADSQCSEIASKMAAMDNATRNCNSLVEKLQIQYNKARQAKITTELIEIISGAESLKG